MKGAALSTILGLILIVCAFYQLDYQSFNKIGVAVILFLTGVSAILFDQNFRHQQTAVFLTRVLLYVSIFVMIIKLILWG